ncbi:hypothetical protein TW95_gp1110 [Pandoravirus inopinatum]|uniref:Uncharacterized protein n=1 Tax=Pandoravirus inopinatum TaxID=1605721 RepID=A0A0B5J2Q0_9VIRU|nr:hypothetical protein TW95_gp1110 [Pandoravirus inopinatum]AJF97844.1 hypothetical protein [Pandoravirus inopinatum]
MLLRTTQPQVRDASRRRPAGRAPPARRVRAVAAPPQLDGTTGAAHFGPGGTVHIDDGIIARYASFVDRARPAASLNHPVGASPLPAVSTPRPSPSPMLPPPTTTPAPRAPTTIGIRRGVDEKASLAPGAPEVRRPLAAPSPPTSPPLLAPPRRHIVGRSPIDGDDVEDENDDDDDSEDDFAYAARPEEPVDRVAVCALALVAALVIGHWRRARP